MNRQKQYLADNVDIMGNVFPTVGENIRSGVKGTTFPDLTGVTNVRLLTIAIDSIGAVEMSENVQFELDINNNTKCVSITFGDKYACSYPIIVLSDSKDIKNLPWILCTVEKNIRLKECPFNTTGVIYIGERV